MRFALPVAMLSAAALLAACGQAPPNRPKSGRQSLRALEVPAPQVPAAAQPGVAAIDRGRGAELLQRVRRALDEVSGFEGEVLARTQGYYKQGQRVNELRKVTIGYKVVWAKPAKFRAEVFNAPDPLMEGAAVVTVDGQNLTARARGVLGFIPIKLTAREPKLGNARNHTFDKFCPSAQIQRTIGPTAVWTVIADAATPAGQPMVLVAIDGVKRLDNEITREVLGIEWQSLALRSLTAYAGETRVTDYTFQKFRWNPKVTAETFKM